MQLNTLAINLPPEKSSYDFPTILQHLKAWSYAQQSLLSQVCRLIFLILVMLATNAVRERSFLQRIKTHIFMIHNESTKNNMMTLCIHKDLTDSLDLLQISNKFVSYSKHKQNHLGKIVSTDHS